jgi:hypothetical protein
VSVDVNERMRSFLAAAGPSGSIDNVELLLDESRCHRLYSGGAV